MLAAGLDLLGFLTVVNLVGRLTESLYLALAGFSLVSVGGALLYLVRAPRSEAGGGLWRSVVDHRWLLLLALVLVVPQGTVAVSTNLWDEAVSSAIHLTGVNQLSEGIYPPRHNALPEIPIKYHYGSIVLAGTADWLFGLPTALSVDVATIGLCLFIFLFAALWLESLGLDRFSAFWGGFAAILGGGLSWLFLERLETFKHFAKTPDVDAITHSYDASAGWLRNLLTVAQPQNFHLRNADGSHSLVPLDVANFLQQHPVPLGIALAILGFCLFERWTQKREFDLVLLFANVACFGLLFLGHAVYAAVACLSTGLFLLARWLRTRSWRTFHEGVLFTLGVTVVAHLHGGMLAVGEEYGASALAKFRKVLGYSEGGLRGFLEWNIAGFGLPLLAGIAGVVLVLVWPRGDFRQRATVAVLGLFALISYSVPQLVFYTSSNSDQEQFTEIAKFFFCTQTALALLSAFAIPHVQKLIPRPALVPAFVLMAAVPLSFCYSNSFFRDDKWNGIYLTPFSEPHAQVGETLGDLKEGAWESFYDATRYERTSGVLSELLLHGGSVFTMTPSRYERTGNGYRLAKEPVAERMRQNSRLTRLLPGAAEQTHTRWYYVRPGEDLTPMPILVKSRFRKAVEEGVLVLRAEASGRELYSVAPETAALDQGVELHWRPRVVQPVRTDWDGDGAKDALFFDLAERTVRLGRETIDLPDGLRASELPMPLVGTFLGDGRADLLFGSMDDTVYDVTGGLGSLVEYDGWRWRYRDSRTGEWAGEYVRWLWSHDIPMVADVDGDGYDDHLVHRATKDQWFVAPNRALEGPSLEDRPDALPFVGRFRDPSVVDLGLWSPSTGELRMLGADGVATDFRWGGAAGDVLVPGDYDGDGLDEVAVWQQAEGKWFFRSVPSGAVSSARFGQPGDVPVPGDYDGDGALDLAVWQPLERRIRVSFDRGSTLGLQIPVPANAVPLVANMH